MTERQTDDGPARDGKDARAERLAAALRDNLKKRKLRARAVPAAPTDADG